MLEDADIAQPAARPTPARKRKVPKAVATKFFVVIGYAQIWFAASVPSWYLCHTAGIGCAIMGIALTVLAFWFKYYEDQEYDMLQETRR
jgi:hypothetical protein